MGKVNIPLCMVELAQTIEEWKDIQSIKVKKNVIGCLHGDANQKFNFVSNLCRNLQSV